MVSILFGANSLDELFERATSETLANGQEDIALNFEICDRIKSRSISAKAAALALTKRLNHINPNVQLLTLKLTDTCVKNGGNHFLIEIASREFMDNLVAVLKNSTSVNREVKYKILDLIKSWAEAFHSKNELFYIQQVYKRLEVEGYPFPKNSRVNPNLFDTTTVPEWSDSDVCMRCRAPFTITMRKHHCRNCGQTFCQPCSSNNIPLPHFGVHESVRVCHGCYLKLKKVVGQTEISENIHPSTSQTSRAAATTVATGIQSTPNEDEDLKRAIELSLKEAQNRFGHASISRPNPIENSTIKPNVNEDEEADLAAAIAASLRETRISQTWPDPTKQLRSNNQNQRTASFPGELSTSEKENIEMFATIVSRIQQNRDDPTRDPNIQELYGEVGALQSKLVQNLEDSMQHHRSYVQLYDKITTAVKLYERLLEERLSNIHVTQPIPRNADAHPQTYPRLSSMTQQYPQKKSYVDYSKYPSSSRASYEGFTSKVEHPTNHSQLQQYGYMYPPIFFNPEQRNPYSEVVAMSSGSEQNGYTRPADPRSQVYSNFTNDNSTNSQSGYCKNLYPQQLAPAPLANDSLQATHTWHPANPSHSHFNADTSSYQTYQPPSDTFNYQQTQYAQSQPEQPLYSSNSGHAQQQQFLDAVPNSFSQPSQEQQYMQQQSTTPTFQMHAESQHSFQPTFQPPTAQHTQLISGQPRPERMQLAQETSLIQL